MLITPESRSDQARSAGYQVHETERFFMAWAGLVFLYGARAGAESIARLAAALEKDPLTRLSRSLHGIFVLLVFDRKERIWQIMVDNAGLYHAYHGGNAIGTSFLELVRAGIGDSRIAPAAAAEFLAHDGVFCLGTLVEGISRIGHNEVVELRQRGVPGEPAKTVLHKELPAGPIDEAAFFHHYAELAVALRGSRVSIDVTGGFDSRLLACLMARYGLDFETSVVGRPGLPDVTIAERVAQVLGKQFHLVVHDASAIELELPELFEQCDGLADLLSYHRSRQLSKERRERGVEVALSGAGGELYKDFWWLQDWPFYNSNKVNFERLYDLRVRPIGLPEDLLAGEAAVAYLELRRRTVIGFERYRAASNTQSYDNIYFFYKMSQFAGRFASSTINNYITVGAPFLDYDNFLFARAMSRRRRFLNRFHREIMSAVCPRLAQLTTTEGVTAQIGARSTVSDLIGFGHNRFRRLAKKVAERAFRRRWLRLPDANAPDMIDRARATQAFRAALIDLKDAGLINHELSIESIGDTHVGRLLTLGMLARHLSGRPRPMAQRTTV